MSGQTVSDDRKTPVVSPFKLHSGSEFGARAGDVFANLGQLEAKHVAYEKIRGREHNDDDDELCRRSTESDLRTQNRSDFHGRHIQTHSSSSSPSPSSSSSSSQRDSTSRDNAGFKRPLDPVREPSRDSGFKRPRIPPSRNTDGGRRRASRHGDDQKGWTYYNLEDVDVSDRTNTAGAMDFLATIGDGLQTSLEDEDEEDSPQCSQREETGSKASVAFRKPRTGVKKTNRDGKDSKDGGFRTELDGAVDDDTMECETVGNADDISDANTCQNRIIFKKPPRRTSPNKPEEQVIKKPGCVVQPEYVVGQKPAAKGHKKRTAGAKGGKMGTRGGVVAIQHILDDGGSDDEGDDGDSMELSAVTTGDDATMGTSSISSHNTDIQPSMEAQTTRTVFTPCDGDSPSHDIVDSDPNFVAFLGRNKTRGRKLRHKESEDSCLDGLD